MGPELFLRASAAPEAVDVSSGSGCASGLGCLPLRWSVGCGAYCCRRSGAGGAVSFAVLSAFSTQSAQHLLANSAAQMEQQPRIVNQHVASIV